MCCMRSTVAAGKLCLHSILVAADAAWSNLCILSSVCCSSWSTMYVDFILSAVAAGQLYFVVSRLLQQLVNNSYIVFCLLQQLFNYITVGCVCTYVVSCLQQQLVNILEPGTELRGVTHSV
jgi:hypothetical protein